MQNRLRTEEQVVFVKPRFSRSDNPKTRPQANIRAEVSDWEAVIEIQCAVTDQVHPQNHSEIYRAFQKDVCREFANAGNVEVQLGGASTRVVVRGRWHDPSPINNALRAALRLLDKEVASDKRTDLRAGVHLNELPTGMVEGTDRSPVTDADLGAQRLCRVAPLHTIYASRTARALIEHSFNCDYHATPIHPTDAHEPLLEGFEIIGEKTPSSRAPDFLGRVGELAVLHDAIAHVAETPATKVVVVQGASGCGKTRLIRKFLSDIQSNADQLHVLHGEGYPARWDGLRTIIRMFDRFRQSPYSDDLGNLFGEFDDLVRSAASGSDEPIAKPLTDILAHLASVLPTVLVIDRIEFLSVQAWSWLADTVDHIRGAGKPMLAILVGRWNEAAFIPDFPDVNSIELQPLSWRDSEKLHELILQIKVQPDRRHQVKRSMLKGIRGTIPGEIANNVARSARPDVRRRPSPDSALDWSGSPSEELLAAYVVDPRSPSKYVLEAVALFDTPVPFVCLNRLFDEYYGRLVGSGELAEAFERLIQRRILQRVDEKIGFVSSYFQQAATRLLPGRADPELRRLVDGILQMKCLREAIAQRPERRAINLEWGGPECRSEAADLWEEAGDIYRAKKASEDQRFAAHCYGNALRLLANETEVESRKRRLRL